MYEEIALTVILLLFINRILAEVEFMKIKKISTQADRIIKF